jgi:hypothetical protein
VERLKKELDWAQDALHRHCLERFQEVEGA